MEPDTPEYAKQTRVLQVLSMVNVGIWAISIIAMVLLVQQAPLVKRLAPILMGGTAAGVALIAVLPKPR